MRVSSTAFLKAASANQLDTNWAPSGSVTVTFAKPEELVTLHALLASPQLEAQINKLAQQHQQAPVLAIPPATQTALEASDLKFTPEQKLAVGIGTGVMTGLGLAMVFDVVKGVAPKSAVVLDIGCALIAGGLFGAASGDVIKKMKANHEGFSFEA
jgi:hypothetical protein